MFLIIIGHNVGMRVIANHFHHSLGIVDRHFTLTLRAICKLAKDLICHTSSPLPSHIVNNSKYYPWFQVRLYIYYKFLNIVSALSCKSKLKVIMFCCQHKCIGAIDDTHISALFQLKNKSTIEEERL